MNINMQSIGYYQNHKDFWNEEDHTRFFESKFNRKFDEENDPESNDLIIEYFEHKEGLYHIEFNETNYTFEVYELSGNNQLAEKLDSFFEELKELNENKYGIHITENIAELFEDVLTLIKNN